MRLGGQVDAVLAATALHAEPAFFKEGQKLLRKAIKVTRRSLSLSLPLSLFLSLSPSFD